MSNQYINIKESELDISIYRIFDLKRFEELIINSKLTLVRPELWEDPFENYLYKYYKNKLDGQNKFMRWYGSDLFGQCWTLRDEADELWRIYSPNRTGIKVKTTIRKLFNILKESDKMWLATCYIGKVDYLANKKIRDIITSDFFTKSNNSSDTAFIRANGLLLKRNEFKYEQEIRLIREVWDKNEIRNSNLLDINIDFNSTLNSVSVDPRLNDYDFNLIRKKLKKLGLKVNIYQSQLYKLRFD